MLGHPYKHLHFINVCDLNDSESGIFDMRAPGGEVIELLGGQMMEFASENIAVAICSIFSTSVTMDPVRSTVQRGW